MKDLDIRAEVLSLKLKGLAPEDIAHKLDITISAVYRHDKEIKKLMKNGDEEELAKMSQEELHFAARAVSSMLPYMEKNLDAIKRQNRTLQSLHLTALEVAETSMNIIQVRMQKDDVTTAELGMLVEMFSTVYNSLYNKNGIQIINMLANSTRDAEADRLDAHKAEMKEALLKHKELASVIDVDID